MEQSSMTALISTFARWYHSQYDGIKVFDDTVAGDLLSKEEIHSIGANMGKGIAFFHPTFEGTEEEALRWIVDHQLYPDALQKLLCPQNHPPPARAPETPNTPSAPENPSITTEQVPPQNPETSTPGISIPESPPNNPPNIEEPPITPEPGQPPHTGETPKPQARIPGETPEELASSIWTPTQYMPRANSSVAFTDRDKKHPTYDFNLMKGPGSRGQIYETSGYNSTFGCLSSY